MACANEHSVFNFAVGCVACAAHEVRQGEPVSGKSLAMGVAAACMPLLPDLLEPAVHPNHRQFFHSLTFAGLVGYGMYRVYHWQPEDDFERLIRMAGLAMGTAYLAHLARDFFTAKSLPVA